MGRFGNSWSVFKQSLSVLRKDKELLLLPVLSFIASTIVVASFLVPGYFFGLFDPLIESGDTNLEVAGWIVLFVMYLLLSFVTIFFNAALMYGANIRMEGGDPTLGTSLRGPSENFGRIFLWAIFAGTVALLIRAIESMLRERAGGVAGWIFGALAGAAWWMATYFAIPVVLFEKKHVGPALGRSVELFKKRWGESIIGEFGIGAAMFALGLLGALLIGVGIFVGFPAAWFFFGLAALWFLFLATLSPALAAIYRVALYRYATKGEVAPYFSRDAIVNSFHAKGTPAPSGFVR